MTGKLNNMSNRHQIIEDVISFVKKMEIKYNVDIRFNFEVDERAKKVAKKAKKKS